MIQPIVCPSDSPDVIFTQRKFNINNNWVGQCSAYESAPSSFPHCIVDLHHKGASEYVIQSNQNSAGFGLLDNYACAQLPIGKQFLHYLWYSMHIVSVIIAL